MSELQITPVTADRWSDLEQLFGTRGACGGCWCMHFRLPRPAYERGKGESNRRALRRLVETGPPPGLLAYHGNDVVGWCALAPREHYPRLARSRAMRPVDDRPVWSVVCLFIARGHRRRGVSAALLEAAADYAAAAGAEVIEGYPVEPRSGSIPDVFAWTGTASAFLKAGYREVTRWLPGRPVMRRELRAPTARRR